MNRLIGVAFYRKGCRTKWQWQVCIFQYLWLKEIEPVLVDNIAILSSNTNTEGAISSDVWEDRCQCNTRNTADCHKILKFFKSIKWLTPLFKEFAEKFLDLILTPARGIFAICGVIEFSRIYVNRDCARIIACINPVAYACKWHIVNIHIFSHFSLTIYLC